MHKKLKLNGVKVRVGIFEDVRLKINKTFFLFKNLVILLVSLFKTNLKIIFI